MGLKVTKISAENLISRLGGTVSAEHLYLTSIHPCSPSLFLFFFIIQLDVLPFLFCKFLTLCFCFFVRNVSCVRVSPTDGRLWVVWGFVFNFFFYTMTPSTLSPCEGDNLYLFPAIAS